MKLKHLVPMLNVSNIEKSLEFYNKALSFELISPKESVSEWRWATIKSGDIELMLAECESAPELAKNTDPHKQTNWPAIYYFYPDDVAYLYKHVRQCGYETTPLETTFYGMTEFSLQDPDGHMLSFGEDLELKNK